MHIETDNLLFIDIETASAKQSYDELAYEWQLLWNKKCKRSLPEDGTPEILYKERAALHAEFSRIVCISFGYYYSKEGEKIFRIKSLYGADELKILKEFCSILNRFNKVEPGWAFAGHNIKDFDLPFISRRLLINGMDLPEGLDFLNLKPWEYTIVDTMQIWKFGDYRNYTSLELLAAALDVPSPKTEMDGSRVGEKFWKGEFDSIAEYCQQDVIAVANVIQRINKENLLTAEKIEFV